MMNEIVASIGGSIVELALDYIQKNYPKLNRRRQARAETPTTKDYFTIVVCELENDDVQKTQTKHILQTLQRQFLLLDSDHPIAVIDFPIVLKSGIAGDISVKDARSIELGKSWLDEKSADLLIWGEVAAKDNVLRLRFLTREKSDGAQKGYKLDDVLELQQDFKSDLEEVLVSVVALQLFQHVKYSGSSDAIRLQPFLLKLKNFRDYGRNSLGNNSFASTCHWAGTAFSVYGRLTGELVWLNESIKSFELAIENTDKKLRPDEWANSVHNLCNVLQTLGERTTGFEAKHCIQQAVAYAGEVAHVFETLNEGKIPVEFALTFASLKSSLALKYDGLRRSKLLQEASRIYEALETTIRLESEPEKFAVFQVSYAGTLRNLGRRMQGKEQLAAFEFARSKLQLAEQLFIKIQEDNLLAQTRQELGALLFVMGYEQNGNESILLLENSIHVSGQALKVRTRERAALHYAQIKRTIGLAYEQIGLRTISAISLKRSIGCFEEALEIYQKPGNELFADDTRKNIALAKASLAQITQVPS